MLIYAPSFLGTAIDSAQRRDMTIPVLLIPESRHNNEVGEHDRLGFVKPRILRLKIAADRQQKTQLGHTGSCIFV